MLIPKAVRGLSTSWPHPALRKPKPDPPRRCFQPPVYGAMIRFFRRCGHAVPTAPTFRRQRPR